MLWASSSAVPSPTHLPNASIQLGLGSTFLFSGPSSESSNARMIARLVDVLNPRSFSSVLFNQGSLKLKAFMLTKDNRTDFN